MNFEASYPISIWVTTALREQLTMRRGTQRDNLAQILTIFIVLSLIVPGVRLECLIPQYILSMPAR